LPRTPQAPLQLAAQEIPFEPEQASAPVQGTRHEVSAGTQLCYLLSINHPNSAIIPSQDQATSPSSSPLIVSNPAAEKDEASSNQVLSEENQAKLKEIFSWLQKDAREKSETLITLRKYLNPSIKSSLKTSKLPWSLSQIWISIMWQ
jgi:hypothetical protein